MIGQRIRARREELELSQAQLGKHMGELLGRDWPRQAVSAAERGARAFTAAELVAFAVSLQTSISGLLMPRADVTEIELGDRGGALPRDVVIASVLPWRAKANRAEAFDEIQETLQRLGRNVINASQGLDPVREDVLKLYEQVVQAMEAASLEGQAAAEGSAL